MPRLPIVTLTTDFGLTDSYVAEMKGVLLARCPDVRIVDVTHGVPPQDVLAGGFAVERVLRAFPAGTVHVAVVDPGVGSDRRILCMELHGQHVLCPDNGLITWAWRRLGGGVANELTWRPPQTSATFHGRDIFAPAAAMLASGDPSAPGLSGPPVEPILLPIFPTPGRPTEAEVIHIDHFGNVTTNVPVEAIGAPPPKVIRLADRSLGPIRRTYADVPEGEPLALIGSSGLLEIAVRNGNAAHTLGLRVGDRLTIEY
jgi:S-adenosylmethionine hydrolase